VAAAETALKDRHVGLGEILAQAYTQVSGQVEVHEKKLAELETRRRRLRDEYDRLRAARRPPVEDAEIIG
jgi:cell division protein FtsB